MFQNWSHISFLHWSYPAVYIQSLLPPGLTVDIYDSRAWLGVTPFIVEKLRPPLLPSLPWLSRFPETNVRTYVVGPDGSRGIWFFTLGAARGAAVAGATAVYGLPYRWASMDVRQGWRKLSLLEPAPRGHHGHCRGTWTACGDDRSRTIPDGTISAFLFPQ